MEEQKEYTIDLMDMINLIKENRKPIFRITGCMFVMAVLYCILAFFFFPKFESEAVLRIKQERGGNSLAAAMAGFTGGFLSMDSLQMDSYVAIAKSRSVVIPVIEATSDKNFFGKYPKYENYLEKNIKIEPVPLTDILKIKVVAKTNEKAQEINRLLLQGFLSKIAELNSTEKSALKQFLIDRLKTSREELDKTETALKEYKAKHRIISPDTNAEIYAGRIAEVEKQAEANKIELEAAKARANAINSQLAGSGSANADNQVLQQYNKQLAEMETTRIAYKEKYTDKHPKLIELEERMAQLKTRIAEEQARIASLQAPSDNVVHQGLVAGKFSSESALAVLKQKAEALQKAVEQNNEELEKLPEIERGYVKLARDYKVASEIYMMLTKKLEETKVTEFQSPNNVQVVDAPNLPDEHSAPRIKQTLALSILLGLLFGCALIVIKEFINRTIRSTADIKNYLELPILGTIPSENVPLQLINKDQQFVFFKWMDNFKEFIWKN